LDIRKNFFYDEGDETLAQVAQRGVDVPPLETFNTRLDGTLSSLIWLKMFLLIAGGVDYMAFKVPSNPNHSMILCLSLLPK